MNKIALIAVRLKSSRLSKKALLTLAKNSACELSLLEVQLQRLKQSTVLDKIVVCTSTHPQDNDILPVCEKLGVPVFRGSELDVMSRFIQAAEQYGRYAVRITGDNLVSHEIVDEALTYFQSVRLRS